MISETSSVPPAPSLYLQLGGEAAIKAAVGIFYGKFLADPLLKPFFEKTDLVRQTNQQIAFLTQALGGPAIYRGSDMKKAHARFAIQQKHFDAVAAHLQATLQSLNVPDSLIDQVLQTIGPLAPSIVNTPDHN